MNSALRPLVALVVLVALLLPGLARAGARPPSQVIVEGGIAFPYGHLGSDLGESRLGFGAGNGFELGFRYRYHLSQTFSISPSFHFVDFKNFNGVDAEIGEYRVECSSYRYGVEFMMMSEGGPRSPRPFLGLGVGMYRNRVKGFYQEYVNPLNDSVNTLGVSFRGGIQIIGLELSLIYHVNRFNTWQFYQSDYRERYNWDSFGIRAAWVVPFGGLSDS